MPRWTAESTTRFQFTKTALQALRDGEKCRKVVHDAKVAGLMAELRPGGNLTFYFYRWLDRRPLKMKIGRFPEITIDQARSQASEWTGSVARGIDPRDRRREVRDEATFGSLCDHWIASHAKPRKKTWREDERIIDKYLGRWQTRKLSRITKVDVQALHLQAGEKHGKYAANGPRRGRWGVPRELAGSRIPPMPWRIRLRRQRSSFPGG